jgi:hypothetical protein
MNILEAIKKESFCLNKVKLAKEYISKYQKPGKPPIRVSSREVKSILQLIPFDDYKLDLAKYAYKHVSDPQNYYNHVHEALFSGREELKSFITNQN